MRHSTIDLTMNVYTDPKLLDVAGAMEALPALPLVAGEASETVAAKATGTDDSVIGPFAPKFAPTTAECSPTQSILDRITGEADEKAGGTSTNGNVLPVKRLRPLSIVDNDRLSVGATGARWNQSSRCTSPRSSNADPIFIWRKNLCALLPRRFQLRRGVT